MSGWLHIHPCWLKIDFPDPEKKSEKKKKRDLGATRVCPFRIPAQRNMVRWFHVARALFLVWVVAYIADVMYRFFLLRVDADRGCPYFLPLSLIPRFVSLSLGVCLELYCVVVFPLLLCGNLQAFWWFGLFWIRRNWWFALLNVAETAIQLYLGRALFALNATLFVLGMLALDFVLMHALLLHSNRTQDDRMIRACSMMLTVSTLLLYIYNVIDKYKCPDDLEIIESAAEFYLANVLRVLIAANTLNIMRYTLFRSRHAFAPWINFSNQQAISIQIPATNSASQFLMLHLTPTTISVQPCGNSPSTSTKNDDERGRFPNPLARSLWAMVPVCLTAWLWIACAILTSFLDFLALRPNSAHRCWDPPAYEWSIAVVIVYDVFAILSLLAVLLSIAHLGAFRAYLHWARFWLSQSLTLIAIGIAYCICAVFYNPGVGIFDAITGIVFVFFIWPALDFLRIVLWTPLELATLHAVYISIILSFVSSYLQRTARVNSCASLVVHIGSWEWIRGKGFIAVGILYFCRYLGAALFRFGNKGISINPSQAERLTVIRETSDPAVVEICNFI